MAIVADDASDVRDEWILQTNDDESWQSP